ncbi:MAG: thiamine pyrophosphate-dependent enzyme [Candidatus Promineifilaceae bacterium]
MTTQMTGGEAVVRSLIALGVDTIFGLPGVQNDNLFNALYDNRDKIRVIHTRHEQGAAYMANGYAQSTDKPGVYTVVPGPGLLNSTGALSTGYAVNAKVLCLAGQIPSDALGKEIGLLHEIPDQLGIIRSLTKWAERIERPEDAARLVTEAYSQLISGRPRPVGLEVPMDVWGKSAEIDLTLVEPESIQPQVNLDAVKEAAQLIGNAKNPVIVVGGGAQHASAEVLALAEMIQAPVIPGRSGRGVVSSRHPLGLTTPDGYKFWGEADVVIGIGSRMYQQLQRWGHDDAMKLVRIDVDPSVMTHTKSAEVALNSDSQQTLTALLNEVPKHNPKRSDRSDEMWAHRAAMDKVYQTLDPQYGYIQALRAELPENGLFVDEVSQMGFASRFIMPVYNPRSFISTGYQGTLGFGFATALGVKVGNPDVPVLSIAGDGGFMYNVQELSTAMRHNINLVTVVFADGAFGNVRRMQKQLYDNRLIASDLHNPNFVKLAKSFGMKAMRAKSPKKLRKALRKAFAANEPVLIEVPTIPTTEMPSPWPITMTPPNRGM